MNKYKIYDYGGNCIVGVPSGRKSEAEEMTHKAEEVLPGIRGELAILQEVDFETWLDGFRD